MSARTYTASLFLVTLFFMNGCGFHLAGHTYPATLPPVHVVSYQPYNPLTKILHRQLGNLSATAGPTLQIDNERIEEKFISVAATSRVRHYLITYHVHYRLLGIANITPNEQIITRQQFYFINEDKRLASEREKARVELELRQQMADALIQQIATLLQAERST